MSLVSTEMPWMTLSAYADGEIQNIDLSKYADKILVLLFYPYDFTFVCPTEISGYNKMRSEYEKEGAVLILVSCDSVYSHKAWAMSKEDGIYGNTLPMLSDKNGTLSKKLGVYMEEEGRSRRATFIVQDNLIVYEVVHSDSIGRSTTELMRVVKALNHYKAHGNVCPLDWDGAKQ